MKIKNWLSVLLAGLTAFSLVSCVKNNTDSSSPDGEIVQGDDKNPSYAKIEELNYDFFKNGSSDFKILIPAEATSNETKAYGELSCFLELSLGMPLSVVKDNQATIDISQKYISVGRTRLFEESGLAPNNEVLKTSGYEMKTVGNSLFLYGSDYLNADYGVIYAVYGFLEEMIDLKIYTSDCYTYETSMHLKMKKFDVLEIPDYDYRSCGTGRIDATYKMRMRNLSGTQQAFGGVHNHLQYLPPEIYWEDHPEWYVTTGKELRLANEEMRLEFIESCKQILRDKPEVTQLFFGLQDNHNPLSVEDAAYAKEKYNTNQSGLNIAFCNQVVTAIEEWLPTEFPNRYLEYSTFAYFEHQEPPVNYDEKTDTFTPHSEWVVPHEKLAIRISYMTMQDWGTPLTSEENAAMYRGLRGWASICDNITIYGYGTNFHGFVIPFVGFQAWEANLRLGYEELGYRGYYDEMTSGGTATAAFEEMRIYIQSEMLWDTSLHYEDLAREFINAYYGEAAPQVWEYLTLCYDNLAIQDLETQMTQGHVTGHPYQSKYWAFELVWKLNGVLEEAEAQYEPLKEMNLDEYQVMINRVRQQKVTPQYLLMRHYTNYLDKTFIRETLDEMYETVMVNGFTHNEQGDEYHALAKQIEAWRLSYL